jgi:hypothetical protein
MIGYELTQTEKESIQDQFYTEWQQFSCALDINDKWYLILSNQDKKILIDNTYSWILDLPQSEFLPKPINI